MSYSLIAFDFDGTLADSYPFFMQVFNLLAERHGFRPVRGDEIDRLRGLDARAVMRHVGLPVWKYPRVAHDFRAMMAERIGEIPLFPGVDNMLRELAQRGHRLAVVSSNSQANVRTALGEQAAHIDDYDCGTSLFGKSARLRALCRRNNLPASRLLYIGDELRDARAAAETGVDFGAVAWGYTRIEALCELAPAWRFDRIEEVARQLSPPPASPPVNRMA